MISYGRQYIDEQDIEEVVSVLRSDYLTQGPKVLEFEKALCEYTGAKYCVTLANGTAALHLAVASLNIDEGAEGITSPITFVASSNSMAYCGIKPVFADIDSKSYNISPLEIKKRISARTRLITPVHFAGQSADMESIFEIARQNGCYVIEDAAHAIGSEYSNKKKIGCCEYSDLTIFSFHPVKTITTCEGGAILTNDEKLYSKLLMLRSHGITKDPSLISSSHGPWYYEMQMLGYNYRITDIQAALGISQLKKLDSFITRRREIVAKYNNAFSDLIWMKTPQEAKELRSCFHLYVSQIDFDAIGKSRALVMNELLEKGIGTQVHYIPVHTQPWYKEKFGYNLGDYPIAESYYEKALSLPLYPAMTEADVQKVISAVRELV